jgi:glycosyltransferase involved in cell wall biosynthesis
MKTSRCSSGDPLSIGFYSPALPGSGVTNGIVTYTGIMRDALQALGHRVIVVTPNEIECAGLAAPIPRPNRIIRRAKMLLETVRPANGADPWITLQILEAFHAAQRAGAQVFEIEESFGWAGRLAGRGIPVVERLHGPHVFVRDAGEPADQKAVGDLREAAEINSFRKVQAITAPTRRLLEDLDNRYGLAAPVVRSIPNPVHSISRTDAWAADQVDPDQILFVGRIDLCKGADVAMRAFEGALQHRPSLKLVMAGPDNGILTAGGDTIHFHDFIKRKLRPETRARIRFLGVQAPERVAELRRQSCMAVIASRFENFPYSIAEAMSVGMPLVTTDTFGGGEMIRPGQDGMVVPVGDVEAMAGAIIEIAGDRARAAQMGRSALRRAAEWLSPARIAEESLEVYRQVIANGKNGTR